jgi:integrase/recombinase XerD
MINTAPTTSLRERMIEDMKLHRLSRATQRNYLRDVTRFATWLGRPPDTATGEDLRRRPPRSIRGSRRARSGM